MSMYTDLHNFTSTPPRSGRFHGFELRVQGKFYFLREKLVYKIDSYVWYHISAASTFFMHGSLTCWTWSTLPKFVAIIPCKNSWTVSCVFTGNIYAPLPTGYLVDIFRKKHFVTFKVGAILIAWPLLFANARTQLHICRVIEGSGNGIPANACPYIQGVPGGMWQTSGGCSLC